MLILVVSDFHIGRGRYFKNGQLNIMEDFCEDERFHEFLNYYSSGKFYLKHIHLVLNGDILNLLHVDIDGIFTHIIDEEITIKAVRSVIAGHKNFFDALTMFLSRPNKKISYIIGNHDAAMAFEGAQRVFRQEVGGAIDFLFSLTVDGVHIEHGQRFEAANSVPTKNYFISGPNGKKILNLPWASLFGILVIPKLKKERPYLDKIRPMAAYVKWCFFHDFPFFYKMVKKILWYVVKTKSSYYTRTNRNFKTTVKLLKQITLYPRYGRFAKRILSKRKDVHTVIMGHTHIAEWRKYPEGKYYFNSGSWNVIPSVDVAQHEDVLKLTYILVDIHSKTGTLREANMNTWYGKWRPFKEEVSSTIQKKY
ncbi:MAG: metallophosphoesterase [Bacteriovoracaceae bacterium]|nr:metallophosphoesterase [Bacteriovoracaceae bacterium]